MARVGELSSCPGSRLAASGYFGRPPDAEPGRVNQIPLGLVARHRKHGGDEFPLAGAEQHRAVLHERAPGVRAAQLVRVRGDGLDSQRYAGGVLLTVQDFREGSLVGDVLDVHQANAHSRAARKMRVTCSYTDQCSASVCRT